MGVTITIITAVYNGEKTFADCLLSLRSQDTPLEHIVIDGGSTDRTRDIFEKYKSPGARYISAPDRGMYDAMNKGLAMAGGEVVGFLNADDCYADPRVLRSVAELFGNERLDTSYGDLVYVDRERPDKVIRYWRSGLFRREKMYWGWMVPHPTFFVRRTAYLDYGGFNLDLGTAADYELMVRLLVRHRLTAGYIPRVLVRMRTGGASNMSVAARVRAHAKDRQAWRVNGLRPYPWTLLCKPVRKISQWFAAPPRGQMR